MSLSTKQKAAALAAGAVVTAAVGAASLPDSAQDLADATTALYAKSEDRGMALPDKPGLWDVITGLDGMVPTAGTEMSLKVSQAGDVKAGDALTLCHQLTAGAAAELVDGTLLAVDTATYEGTTYAAVVFNREVDGEPYAFLGAVELGSDGTATMGDVVILTAEALSEADVAILPATGQAVAVYPKDGRALAAGAQIGVGATLTDLGRCEVVESGSPYNLRIAATSAVFAVSCVRTVADVPTLSVVMGCQRLPETGLGYTPAVDMTADAFPVLEGCVFDPASAPERWDLAVSGDGREMTAENIGDKLVVYLSCPKADGKGQYVVPVRMAADTWLAPTGYTDQGVDWAVSGPTAVNAGWGDRSLSTVVTVNRCDKPGAVWATMELYCLDTEESIPQSNTYCITEPQTVQDVTEVGGALGTPGAVSMAADGKLYVTPCELGGDATGPTVTAAEDIVRGTVITSEGNTVWCVTQGGDGWIRLLPLTAERVVRKASPGDTVDGTVIQGGKPGELCRASIWRPPDDDYFAPDVGGDDPA